MAVTKLIVVYGGELAKDIAEQIIAKRPASSSMSGVIELKCASEKPKSLLDVGDDTLVCFVMQTIENSAPTEEGGPCVRFLNRKTHPDALLKGKFCFTVLGVGDSNLLLDRQTTTAKDCNQVAQQLDSRLKALSGQRFYDLGLADERTGLQEVEPWINGLWAALGDAA